MAIIHATGITATAMSIGRCRRPSMSAIYRIGWFPPREKPSLGMETPSTKPQAPKKVQISNTKLQKQMAGPTARRSIFELSGHEHNYDDVRGEGFFGQTRRERRAYPTGSVRSEQR